MIGTARVYGEPNQPRSPAWKSVTDFLGRKMW